MKVISSRFKRVQIKPLCKKELKSLIKTSCPETSDFSDIWEDKALLDSLNEKEEVKKPVIVTQCTYREAENYAKQFNLVESKPHEVLFVEYPNLVSTEICFEDNINWLYSKIGSGKKSFYYKGATVCFKKKYNFLYFAPFKE